jgi:hypothetical protein
MNENPNVPPGFRNQKTWRKLLVSWLDLVERYENREGQEEEQDFCYWYNERPLTGILGAAAWAFKDGWSLEEFGAKRKVGDTTKKGRPDLLVGLGVAEAAVEAKIWWVEGRLPAAQDNVVKMLDQAREQLQGLQRWKVQTVSICFVVPWYKGSDGKERGRAALTEIKRWADAETVSKMATAIHISQKNTHWKGREYPGVVLVARQEEF